MAARRARSEDWPDVAEQIGVPAAKEAGVPWRAGVAHSTYCTSVVEGGAWLVEGEDGRLAGLILGTLYDAPLTGVRTAGELFTYVCASHRRSWTAVSLLRAWARWGARMGAESFVLGISSGIAVERTAALYRRIGLQPDGQILRFRLDVRHG